MEKEPGEKANIAAKQFNIKASTISIHQLRNRNQQCNTRGTFNPHGRNNIILTSAQEKAVYKFCYEQWKMGLPTTFSIIFAATSNLRKQEKLNPPSCEWF